MGVKPDTWIRRMAVEGRMIEPFVEEQVRDGVVSYGLSSYGYDLRVGDEFRVFAGAPGTVVDPKRFDEGAFATVRGAACEIPPSAFALARKKARISSRPAPGALSPASTLSATCRSYRSSALRKSACLSPKVL